MFAMNIADYSRFESSGVSSDGAASPAGLVRPG